MTDDALARRAYDIRAVLTEHTDAEGDPTFFALICNRCGATVTALSMAELRGKTYDWKISVDLGGEDFCPRCLRAIIAGP